MKKNTIIILAIVVVILGSLFVLRLVSPEDNWICVDNSWVKHGNPSAPKPANGCGDSVAVIAIDFDETGHFVKDNPGLKPGVWYLVYEKPGSPALYKELVFDNQSVCMFNGKQGTCPDVLLPSSALTHVRGMISGEVVRVAEATSGGTTSTEKITYTNATDDLVKVELPSPGAVVGKNFSVIGTARGTWFFEASFPVQVLDKNGKLLVSGPAQAQSDWMTENFVPFKIDIKIPGNYTGPATLVLKKDNPSGLPEHDASISFPIIIEY
jgi:hypothetical protein